MSLKKILVAGTATVASAQMMDNGVGMTPQMGWNSWNSFACDINEELIKSMTEEMILQGFDTLGYNYINMDDCWQSASRIEGKVVADETAFPSGIGELASFVHSKGLKFGLYSSAGTKTCAGRAGGLWHEWDDAQQYAAWGVDYLKYDNCFNDGVYGVERYNRMRDALNATGRPIFYSLCSWGTDDVAEWGKLTGNSWRTTGDINSTWRSIRSNFLKSQQSWMMAGPGHWNDPDMLEVGVGHLTFDEEVTHFALWAFAKAPLIIGADLTKAAQHSLDIMKNTELIAINQDSFGEQAHCVTNCPSDWVDVEAVQTYLSYQLDGNYYASVSVNWNSTALNHTIDFVEIGVAASVNQTVLVRDMVTHEWLGKFQGNMTLTHIPSHGVRALKYTSLNAANNEDLHESVRKFLNE